MCSRTSSGKSPIPVVSTFPDVWLPSKFSNKHASTISPQASPFLFGIAPRSIVPLAPYFLDVSATFSDMKP